MTTFPQQLWWPENTSTTRLHWVLSLVEVGKRIRRAIHRIKRVRYRWALNSTPFHREMAHSKRAAAIIQGSSNIAIIKIIIIMIPKNGSIYLHLNYILNY